VIPNFVKTMMRYITAFLVSLVMMGQVTFAKNYSYVYIEGDKQTPFYVKLEGQMLPRLGKNYCIIPNLDAGITNIEILFQQNKFPAQKFVIRVPAEGSRGFVLQKVNERQFALYDMQQGIYLISGNTVDDDHAPVAGTASPVPVSNVPVSTAPVAASDQGTDIPAFTTEKKSRKKKPVKATEDTSGSEQKPATSTDNRFIGDIELNADGTQKASGTEALPDFNTEKKATASKKKPVKKAKHSDPEEQSLSAISDEIVDSVKQAAPAVEQGMPNTDCKSPMTSEDFENFALKILDKADDDARLKVLNKSKGRLCFTTEQVRIIANNLDTQSGRYEVARILYAQTSDQTNYPQLESLFKTNYLKNKFREIINPK
jgi:hypothetical protein